MDHEKLNPDLTIGKTANRMLVAGCVAFLLALAAPSRAAQPLPPLELLKQLNRAVFDPTQVYAIRDAHIKRGGMDLYLNRGFIAFITPVQGEVTGAIFWGDGEVLVIPPNRAETRNLALFTHSPILDETIKSIYLRFTDRTFQELLAASQKPDPDDPEQPGPVVEQMAAASLLLNPGTSVRILADLLGDRTHPYFYARVSGMELGVFEIADDQRRSEPFSIVSLRKVGAQTFTDVWCSYAVPGSGDGSAQPLGSAARAQSYKLQVQIHPDRSLDGRAEIQLKSLSALDRVISFDLSRWLTVTSAQNDDGSALMVMGGVPREGSLDGPRDSDRFEVVLPQAYPVGASYRLVFKYRGNVITDVGNGVLYVGARGNWYPNLDVGLPAEFDMTFQYPRKLALVATGERLEEKTDDQESMSRWRSDGVFRVAGFNLGPYTSAVRYAGKTEVSVYATREAEEALAMRHRTERESPLVLGNPQLPRTNPVPPVTFPLVPTAMLSRVAAIASQAVEFFSTLFGPYPYPRLTIAQAPGSFGQGWPELVYLPTLSFLPKSDRTELGLSRGRERSHGTGNHCP